MVPQHQCFAHYCSSAVVAVQSEEIESWGAELVVAVFEILGLQLALLAVHSATQDGTQVHVMMNQHRT
jgi:phosphate/sulfate permease